MSSTADKLIDDYLKRLNRELAGFPRARRRELVDEISEHIAEARADLESENEAAIRTLLDRLGDPEDIAAEARERFGARSKGSGWDVVALIMLLVGGVILPVIGWIIGVVLLWVSETWTTREKLVGSRPGASRCSSTQSATRRVMRCGRRGSTTRSRVRRSSFREPRRAHGLHGSCHAHCRRRSAVSHRPEERPVAHRRSTIS